ncbi:hypothetical protein DOE76_12585 [Leifsonia sp. ku-ls]|nr:hypothetical protein DOE76_12585 [Leifsonia sp. ku-ls]
MIASLLVAASVGAMFAGCSLWHTPPEALVARADAVAAEVRRLPGVVEATAEVASRDSKDHPADWVVTVGVKAADAGQLTTLPAAVADSAGWAGLGTAWSIGYRLSVPGSARLAPVLLEQSMLAGRAAPATREAVVAAADAVRRLPSAGSVAFAASGGSLALTKRAALGPTPLATAAAELHALPGFGTDALSSIDVTWRRDGPGGPLPRSVTVAATGPSGALVTAIGRLAARADVAWISATDNRDGTRPLLGVATAHPDQDGADLAAAADPAAEEGRRPRTRFRAESGSDGERSVTGYVGLPPGSPEPPLTWAQLRPGTPAAEPHDVPEPARGLDASRSEVDAFLRAAAATASPSGPGVPPSPRVDTTGCDTGAGSSVQAELLLPLWEAPDATEQSLQAAFDRITASWAAAGFQRGDRAMGTDYWMPAAGSASGLRWASIRGTAEGLRVRVASVCSEE